MAALYPFLFPYATHRLTVDKIHRLYIEECGNKNGLPVIFLHGGPGIGCDPVHRRYFDPKRYRIILIDQRGCGRSTPFAALTNNNTQALLSDLEQVRLFLDIQQWLVFGGSWGATLALLYAQQHSEHVVGLVLRGIFLCRQQDIQWFYQHGASEIRPDLWQDYISIIPKTERNNLVSAYYKRLIGKDVEVRAKAAEAWCLWEARCASLVDNQEIEDSLGNSRTALSMARIEAHYFIHNSFIEANQILNNAKILADIPGIIIHGRYDIICPMENAWSLHQAWPEADLKIIPDAGHAASEPGIEAALVDACNYMADRFAPRLRS